MPQVGKEPEGSRGTVERREVTGRSRVRPERERIQRPADRDTTFRGIGEGNFERKASERGGVSRQSGDVIRRGKGVSRQDRGGERKSGDTSRPGRGGSERGGFRR